MVKKFSLWWQKAKYGTASPKLFIAHNSKLNIIIVESNLFLAKNHRNHVITKEKKKTSSAQNLATPLYHARIPKSF